MLNEETIQERIFDYHEGVLDASQKAELMDYLHQHPEWQREFTLWAQVRLHDEPVKAPALQKRLTRNLKKPYWAWAKIALPVGIGAGLLYLLLVSKEETKTKATSIQNQDSIALVSPTTAATISSPVTTGKKKTQATVTVKAAPSLITEPNPIELAILPDTVAMEPIPSQKTDSIPTVVQVESPKMTIDSTATKPNTKTAKPALTSEKKKKKRPKMSLMPTSDFIPSNPNF